MLILEQDPNFQKKKHKALQTHKKSLTFRLFNVFVWSDFYLARLEFQLVFTESAVHVDGDIQPALLGGGGEGSQDSHRVLLR